MRNLDELKNMYKYGMPVLMYLGRYCLPAWLKKANLVRTDTKDRDDRRIVDVDFF